MPSATEFRIDAFRSTDHPDGGRVRTLATAGDLREAQKEVPGVSPEPGEEVLICEFDKETGEEIDRIEPRHETTWRDNH